MKKILRNPNISAIHRAIEDNLYGFWKTCSRVDLKNVSYIGDEKYYKFSTEIPSFMVNGVIDTKIPPEIAEKSITDIIQSFKEDNLPFHWDIGPLSKPTNLKELLLQRNPTVSFSLPGLALNLKELSTEKRKSPKITIVKVQDIETFKIWTKVMLNAFELPLDLLLDFYFETLSLVFLSKNSTTNAYLAYFNEKPVASSIGFYGSGVIGLYGIATLKEARGNRIGSAITLAPLYEAKDLGYEIGVLHSSEIGLNLYKRIGFKEYIQIERFIWNF